MESLETIQTRFRSSLDRAIYLSDFGDGRILVRTPFTFDDGDFFKIVLVQRGENRRYFTDEGHTLMHMSYWLDDASIYSGNRADILSAALEEFHIVKKEGELIRPIEGDLEDAFFDFLHALIRISDISLWTRDRVRSTFLEDFRNLIHANVPGTRLSSDWHDPGRDPQGHYVVDYRINSMAEPLFVFGLNSPAKISVATISLLNFERWGIPFRSLGVFESQEEMDPKAVARFTDVAGKIFSGIAGEDQRERIVKHLHKAMEV